MRFLPFLSYQHNIRENVVALNRSIFPLNEIFSLRLYWYIKKQKNIINEYLKIYILHGRYINFLSIYRHNADLFEMYIGEILTIISIFFSKIYSNTHSVPFYSIAISIWICVSWDFPSVYAISLFDQCWCISPSITTFGDIWAVVCTYICLKE